MKNEYKIEFLNRDMGYFFKMDSLVFQTETKYQNLKIYETKEYGRILCLDDVFQTSEFDEFLYHEPLIHAPLLNTENPKSILIIGGGDGGAIKEALKYPSVTKVTIVELDEDVIQYSKKYLPNISLGAFNSPKVEIIIGDGKAYLENTNNIFDVIILDLTDPFGAATALYTSNFYNTIKTKLSNTGCLALHIQSPITRPYVFQRMVSTLQSVFKYTNIMLNYIPFYGTLWGFSVSSNYTNLHKISTEDINKKLTDLKLNLKFYNGATHHALLNIPPYIKEILHQPQEIITNINKDSLMQDTIDKNNIYFII